MAANIVDSERNICQAPAVLRRGSKKYDGTLSLSNIRLHFKGMDGESWSYPLDSIVAAKVKNLMIFFAEGVEVEFSDGRKEVLALHDRENWVVQILAACAAYRQPYVEPKLHQVIADEVDRGALRRNLTQHFSNDELNSLCFDLDIDYDNIEGDNKEAKVRELITYCNRSGRLLELLARCRTLRPSVDWLESG
jgi:hypothetical protein